MLFALGVASFFTGLFEGVLMLIAVLIGSVSAFLSTNENHGWSIKFSFGRKRTSHG
jgi:hypothetical protein